MKLANLLLTIVPLAAHAADVVKVSDKKTNDSSPWLYGMGFEDISHSGESGIYGELLVNRAFQGPSVNISGFYGVGGVGLKAAYNPLSDALPMALQAKVPPQTLSEVGIWNEGWRGIEVKKGRKYKARFYAKTPKGFDGEFKVSLRRQDGKKHLADAVAKPQEKDTHLYPKESNGYVHYECELEAKETAKDLANGLFIVLEKGEKYIGQTFWFNIVSLFPAETFKGRDNGLRKDIADVINGMGMKMMRIVGLNQLEGLGSPYNRWYWNQTVGPLTDRPGRWGNWGYANSDGLGLNEYMEWCEDMNLEPIVPVYDGLTIKDDFGPYFSYEKQFMQEIIDDALDQLEYLTGDSDTKFGKLRQQHGRKDPYKVNYVEIGNEDQFGKGYDYRFPMMHKSLKKKHPNITFIASTNKDIKLPDDGTWQDPHFYLGPKEFISKFADYDHYPRNNTPVSVGEYQNVNYPNGTRMKCPYLYGSVAEAVYAIGLERNSDQVANAVYAPTMYNQDLSPHATSMLGVGLKFGEFTKTTSFYVQQMFAQHKGDKILQLQNTKFDPTYYVASLNSKKKEVYIKIANTSEKKHQLQFELDVQGFENPKASSQALTSDDMFAMNCAWDKNKIGLTTPDVKVDGNTVSLDVSPYFAGVIKITQS